MLRIFHAAAYPVQRLGPAPSRSGGHGGFPVQRNYHRCQPRGSGLHYGTPGSHQQTAENAKAVTTTVTALQQSVASLLMLTTAMYNTGKSYTKVFTSATKTETTTQEPASTL